MSYSPTYRQTVLPVNPSYLRGGGETVQVMWCENCGALIMSIDAHNNFHERQK